MTAWGADHWSWNPDVGDEDECGEDGGDGSGRPGRMLVAAAIASWMSRVGPMLPEVVAAVFNLPIELVHDALSEGASPGHMPTAIQVWSMLQSEGGSVIEAASLFSMTPAEVAANVADHYYMFLEPSDRGLLIGHEGE